MTARILSTACGVVGLLLSGCSMFSSGEGAAALTPQDFAGPSPTAAETATGSVKPSNKPADSAAIDTTAPRPAPTSPATPATAAPAAAPAPSAGPTASTTQTAPAAPAAPADGPSPPPPATKPGDKPAGPVVVAAPLDNNTLTVDAMIGQINGRPLYAGQVLKSLEGQFRALTITLQQGKITRGDFVAQIHLSVYKRLQEIVHDSLFLGEAERILTDQERFGLQAMLRHRREELIRKFGNGSESTANEAIKVKFGRDLDAQMQRMKEEFLTHNYLQAVLSPKISVSRRDIERYYNDVRNRDQFHSAGGRRIRMIRVSTEASAERVDDMLKAGRPFLEVAASRLNQFNPDDAGKFVIVDDKKKEIDLITGDKVFGSDAQNKALLALKAGEHSQRITLGTGTQAEHYWLFLESLIEAKSRSMAEAQLDIEETLKGMQYKILRDQTNRRLFEEAGFGGRFEEGHPLYDMNKTLVRIALNLYAP